MIDYYDEPTGLTAMMRTTAFPAAESALLLARGDVAVKGVPAPEEVIPGAAYLSALRARGMRITEVESVRREE
jgi:lysine 6-dehydrogenase